MDSIPKNYDASSIENKWSQYWIQNKTFSQNKSIENQNKLNNDTDDAFVMIIPPPNVTGNLHIGHALNNTYQDILVRKNKMAGKKTIWVPGTDHAGIATQTKVEKELIKEFQKTGNKFDRCQMGRDKFLEKIWEWKSQYGHNITNQLQRLGCGCDWDRMQFTMDKHFSDLVKTMFVNLYNDNLIYRGEYIVNWCPVSQTALANEEVIYEDQKSKLYYVKYYLINENDDSETYIINDDSPYITVATTRPETILGDTAIAFHPSDTRYQHLEGKTVIVPIVNRKVKMIADRYPQPEFGTGLVKITPAHDVNDFKVGQRHNLEQIKVINEQAQLYNTNSQFDGMDRFEARKAIVETLYSIGQIAKEEDYNNRIGRSYRSGAIVESLLSKQWFVRMKPLAEMTLKYQDEINFYPAHQKDVFKHWLENIQDWCISRQIWWGHQIPVWYGSDGSIKCQTTPPVDTDEVTYQQDPDVLDTWFSSWLWPIGVFPDSESQYRNQTNVLITASDILFFWVIRMLMASIYLTKQLPFKNIYLHGLIKDKDNLKMSKSKGNVIDPLQVIEEYSADAIRFSLTMKTPYGQDVPFSHKDVELGRNFATKLWNTMRYIIDICQTSRNNFESILDDSRSPDTYVDYLEKTMIDEYHKNNPGYDWSKQSQHKYLYDMLDGFDIWILGQLYQTVMDVEQHYKTYNFSGMTTSIYTFVWHKFCSVYLETTKYEKDKISKQFVLNNILNNIIRLIHPIMPYLTEELWYRLSFTDDKEYQSICNSNYFPETSEQNNKNVMHLYNIREGATDINLKKYMILIKNIRSIKSDFMIPLSLTNEDGTKQTLLHGDIVLNNIDSDLACFVMENKNYLILDTKINSIALETDSTRKYYQILNDDMVLLYPVDTLFKFDKKINIITTKITKTTNNITKIETKLDTTTSDKKKHKLSNELKIIHQQINNLTDELRYYKELEQISMK
jgi:valyl-tRNA synthetase